MIETLGSCYIVVITTNTFAPTGTGYSGIVRVGVAAAAGAVVLIFAARRWRSRYLRRRAVFSPTELIVIESDNSTARYRWSRIADISFNFTSGGANLYAANGNVLTIVRFVNHGTTREFIQQANQWRRALPDATANDERATA